MKSFFTIVLILLLSAPTHSQELTGFWGIDFHTSKSMAKRLMKGKNGVSFLKKDYKPEGLIFEGGEYMGFEVDKSALYMFKKKFFRGVIILKPSSDSTILQDYRTIKQKLCESYGAPFSESEEYKIPNKGGNKDIDYINAIKEGKAIYNSMWIMKPNHYLTITLLVRDGKEILMTYSDQKIGIEVRKYFKTTGLI